MPRLLFILKESSKTYSPEDVKFLEPWLFSSEEKIAIVILKILCKFGNPVSKYVDQFESISSNLSMEIMRIAADQDDPDTIVELASEDKKNMNNAVIFLSKMGKKGHLATFLFSEDDGLIKLIRDI